MANVRLQVVGIFYDVIQQVADSGLTVADLMGAATHNPGGETGSINGAHRFNFSTHYDYPGAPPTMSGMAADYASPFTSRVLTNHYPAGTYGLKESFDPNMASNQYTVWQYYMFDSNNQYVNPSSVSESFSTQSLDGISRVTWRLVTILGAPSSVGTPNSKRAPMARMMPMS